MSVAKKPQQTKSVTTEDVISSIINKGGSPSSDNGDKPVKLEIKLLIRVPSEMVGRLDAIIRAGRIKKSRNTWILEAILDKINKDESDLEVVSE